MSLKRGLDVGELGLIVLILFIKGIEDFWMLKNF